MAVNFIVPAYPQAYLPVRAEHQKPVSLKSPAYIDTTLKSSDQNRQQEYLRHAR